ncbi:(2E,6E)-farnesyl diphosphate synthase [Idiomarina sp.]|uniref:(2E,6E)-farnesyl diphosphate synthase n=1 Tax=Idiomarina sp. TaxID=1874361 RepID=UPI0025BD1418|nr:farnesyl diphosphate synthase [Idiomarina sp.]MEC7644005.1 farnesyl diphosphate synthase [Pseudomonadota bacterium]NQZ05362.1 (2E,6E)-farnesyl diphosphate synthase [Idiomarina sp.]
MNIKQFTADVRENVDRRLNQLIEASLASSALKEAMAYGVLLGGKRIRPYLTMTVAELCGAKPDDALDAACAVELIHAYSLIHDDLPAMDDDELRRGHPTCHIKFGEATAILAGDALQTLAFEVLSSTHNTTLPAARRIAMIQQLAQASGANGMCLGQALDLNATGQPIDEQALESIHRHKTGALIRASAALGALSGSESSQQYLSDFCDFASWIGLAYQVYDDILDVVGNTEIMGKPQGSDQAHHKATYVALLGLDGANEKLLSLHQQALLSLNKIPYNTQKLETFSEILLRRDH